ncbi:MAG: glucose 1-dehydrogenase [Thermoprotei archaeon]|jgi:3-oxoacyl-[acyl-carrier protein] reductase
MVYEDLKNKVVLITGASRGIGRAIAKEFHKHGSIIAANYNTNEELAKQLKRELGERVEIFKADISDHAQVKEMIERVHVLLGKIDIVINNAGILHLMKFEDYREDHFEKMLKINLFGSIYTILETIPDMKEKRNGVIVNIASNAGLGTSLQGTTFYAITKASIIILTKRLAFELGMYGIRVNAIAPGWISTDMTIGDKTQEEIDKTKELIRSKTMLNVTGEPEDIAKVAVFLASNVSRYITGQIIVVDGGRIDYLTHSI